MRSPPGPRGVRHRDDQPATELVTTCAVRRAPGGRFLEVEEIVRRAGWINTGFIGAWRGSAPFLDWWAARLLRHCSLDRDIGLGDQGWVDIAPGLFPDIEWADPGVNGVLHSPGDRRHYRAALERWERGAGPEPRWPFDADAPPAPGPRARTREVGSRPMTHIDPMETTDFTALLHELRGRELERVPGDARVVLSGGAAGDWYFPWFRERYAGTVERHVGVEAYAPPPPSLPAGVEWLPRTLGDLDPVADGSIDLVFAGQTVEHLWPSETAGFLAAAHRVLRPDGRLVLDSPNRLVTQSWAVVQPEHTLEFSADEIVEVVELAGFDVDDLRGVWLCYDRGRHRMLPVDDLAIPPGDRTHRIEAAAGDPEGSFVWWLEARRSARAPDAERVWRRLNDLGDRFRAVVAGRTFIGTGEPGRSQEDEAVVRAGIGQPGAAVYGPFMPMPPGAWRALFTLGVEAPVPADVAVVAALQVTVGGDATPVAERHVAPADLPEPGAMRTFALDFDLVETTTMGLQTRVIATGLAPFTALTRIPVSARVG